MRLVWKQIAIAFVMGALAGTAAGWWSLQHQWRQMREPGRLYSRMLDEFTRQLRLTPAQHTQVAAVLDEKRRRIDALRAQVRPQFDAIRQDTTTQIRVLLTPEQQRTFDHLQVAWEHRWDAWRRPPH